jgi:hypothetical protein
MSRATRKKRDTRVERPARAIPIGIPANWSIEDAIAVVGLLNDLSNKILAGYKSTNLQPSPRRCPLVYGDDFKIDEEDIPF